MRRCRASPISRCSRRRAARPSPNARVRFRCRSLREDGIEPLALNAYLARIGTSDSIEPALSLKELADGFAFEKMGRALAHFDMHELLALNAKTLHAMPYALIAPRLAALHVSEDVWDAVKPNVARLTDAVKLQA